MRGAFRCTRSSPGGAACRSLDPVLIGGVECSFYVVSPFPDFIVESRGIGRPDAVAPVLLIGVMEITSARLGRGLHAFQPSLVGVLNLLLVLFELFGDQRQAIGICLRGQLIHELYLLLELRVTRHKLMTLGSKLLVETNEILVASFLFRLKLLAVRLDDLDLEATLDSGILRSPVIQGLFCGRNHPPQGGDPFVRICYFSLEEICSPVTAHEGIDGLYPALVLLMGLETRLCGLLVLPCCRQLGAPALEILVKILQQQPMFPAGPSELLPQLVCPVACAGRLRCLRCSPQFLQCRALL